MDIYEQMLDCFSRIPCAGEWDEMKSLFRGVASKKPRHWLLPVRACEAVGGTPEQALPAATAIACSHIGIILIDDMLDADPRGEYHRIGMPAAVNMASALQAASLEVIAAFEGKSHVKLTALQNFNRMFLTTALGQLWDVNILKDESDYWRITQTKSSPFFGSALQLGALMGGAPIRIAGKLRELGCLYGEMIQIHDDLNDVMEVPANPDWTEGRSPLPILFARLVGHPDRLRFVELCGNISGAGALEEAQEILIRSGAISYCVDQLIYRYKMAKRILHTTPLIHKRAIDELIEEVIAPVQRLFQALDELPPTNESACQE